MIHSQKHTPKAIYIENTRGEDLAKKGKRIPDRLSVIEKYYQELGNMVPERCRIALEECKENGTRLTDRQYLYFIQLGESMYSRKTLEFDDLELYDIDHVLPQSYIKDDSIENRVLVYPSENRRKADSLLLEDDIQQKMTPRWRELLSSKLIGQKKFKNLTRRTVDDEEMQGFINRQLVETSQIIKHVVALFKAHYPETEVRAVNARLSSSMRDTYQLYKIRELNNTHHAFDAFLACTIGCFTDLYLQWIGDDSVAASRIKSIWKLTKTEENGILLNMFNHDQIEPETGEILRNAAQHIGYIRQVWGYRDHFIVHKTFEYTAAFYNETKYPAGSKEAKIPLRKDMPVNKYGGYGSVSPAYIAAITYKKGKKRAGTLVSVPAYLAEAVERDPQVLQHYLAKDYQDVQIVCPRIMLNQKIAYEGSELLLRSDSEAWNARELYLPTSFHQMLYELTHLPAAKWKLNDVQVNSFIGLLIEKLKILYPIYSGVYARIIEAKDRISLLSTNEKAVFAMETMKIMQPNGNFAMYGKKLNELGLKDNQGRITNKSFDLS